MKEFNYDNIFLVGEIQNKELLFMEINVDNFSFKYITTQSFTVGYKMLKGVIKSLDNKRLCNIIDLLENDGLEAVLYEGDLGNNILSEIYKDFFLYTIDDDNITVFTKTDISDFDEIEHYNKGRFDNILKALNFKNDEWLEEQIKLYSVFDDIESFYLKEEEEEIIENKKEDFLTAFGKLLNDYNIKF